MRLRTENALALVLWLAALAVSLWGHFNLPPGPMATHFDAAGHANGYMPRDMGLSVAPAMMLALIVLLFWLLPAILPKSTNIDRFEGVYGLIVQCVLGVLLMSHILTVASASGLVGDQPPIAFVGIGLLFIVIGNYLPKTRRNWLVGVRNPWTLSDDRVWDRVNRFAGPLLMLSGLAVAMGGFIVPVSWRLPLILTAALWPVPVLWIYSYLSARRLGLV